MKQHLPILLLILTLPFAGHTASEYAITKKHRVIQEAPLQPSHVPIGTKISRLTFTTLHGKTHNLNTLTAQGPVVFAFLATECPVAQRYTMRLKRLHAEFAPQNTTFVAVYANENDSEADVKNYIAKADYPVKRGEVGNLAGGEAKRDEVGNLTSGDVGLFLVVKDTTGELARTLGATMTPQAVLVDTTHTVTYRGAIDDNRYEPRVKHHYLQDALLATHTDTAIPVQETPAFGCTIHFPETGLPTEVTYSDHIASILQKNCQTCHRHGEVAPFTLTDYSDAKAWATEIAEYTQARLMPPWKPASGYGDFKNERQLTHPEIQMIAHWVEAGAPAGDLDTVPPAPEFPEGWALGEPDWIAEMPVEYEIEPEGEDEYRQFIIPTNFETDMYVQAVDVQPGNRKTVHHVIAYLDVEGEARKLDAQDPKPGYVTEGTGPGFDSAGTVGGWAPGVMPLVLPEGVGYLLPKGADIVMQVHYYRTGHLERDRSRLGLYFSKIPETAKLHIGDAINSDFVIPAGENWYEVLASETFKRDVYLLATMPHMHLLGRDMRLVATTPTGDKHDLIWIQDWDFNWQDVYHYREPLFFPAGTRVDLVAHFDNSVENPANPHNPPLPVGWGEKTTDEMCIGFLYYVKASEFSPR